MKFRKKPIVIDAIRVDEALQLAAKDWYNLPQWLRDAYEGLNKENGTKGILFINHPPCIEILTGWGAIRADIDDWIVKEGTGIHRRGPKEMETSYEAIE